MKYFFTNAYSNIFGINSDTDMNNGTDTPL